MKQQTRNYSNLLPPSNPAYPWKAGGWQLLCYYCAQPVYETTPEAGDRQRTIYMRGMWLHIQGDAMDCDPNQLRPDSEIDDPRCHVCQTQTREHGTFCSCGGQPRHRATTMSEKESELIAMFGWNPDTELLSSTSDQTKE